MKNYVAYFEFFSGFYESCFYKALNADDEKIAITQLVSFFLNSDEENATRYIAGQLGLRWSVDDFWKNMDMDFFNQSEGYKLIWLKEVDFDLQQLDAAT